mmetsp:Transcript_1967/g.2897  ORF Transcript_1967/g.2897 Transcript_1967/m.2897 type:complete len:565 (+) Transcript_1967:70-1764(+)
MLSLCFNSTKRSAVHCLNKALSTKAVGRQASSSFKGVHYLKCRSASSMAQSPPPTEIAQQQQDDDSLDALCRKHIDLPAQEFAMGCSLLHQVAMGMDPFELAGLLNDRPDLVNFRDYDRRTPLHVAASEGHLELCQFLVSRGAKINRSDRWGGSPLDDAHRHRHTEVVEFLKEHGATYGSPSQANSFITAAAEGDLEEVQALFTSSGGALLNKCDNDLRTALHWAAAEGRTAICEFLCKAGADVNTKDRFGNTPLDDAESHNNNSITHNSCIRVLKHRGGFSGSSADKDQDVLLDLMQQYGKVRENGLVSMDWHDVKDLLEGSGEQPTDACVQKLFEVADSDGDGLIYCKDFLANSDTFLAGRPAGIILLVGGPGSGKGVLSGRLAEECGLVHLSSGDLLRNEVAQGTALGKKVEEIMKAGELVSSAIMVSLMRKVMKDHPGKRILLDGFPRSQENARDLVELCGKPELALHLECDDTILMERIMKRAASATEEGGRADDNFHTALQRIRAHHKYTHLTRELLREHHVPIVFLDASATAEGVWKQLSAIGRMMRPAVKRRPPRK